MNLVKVVIADDEAWIRSLLRNMVDWQGLGLRLTGEAENGNAALAECERKAPDILITDVKMPGMDGLELISRASAILPDLVPIVISGYDDFGYAQRAIREQVIDYVLKPINKIEIETVLQKAVRIIRERRERTKILHNTISKVKKLESDLACRDSEPGLPAPTEPDERIARARAYMLEHFDENPTLSQIADFSCMNKTYFCEMFKSKTVIGFGRLMHDLKMEKARSLLAFSTLSVREIAEAVGFSDAGYFSRVFRKHFRQSPEACRESIRTGAFQPPPSD